MRYELSDREGIRLIPVEGLEIGDTMVIKVRGQKGEFWANEYRHWDGQEWVYDGHGDPPGAPGPKGPIGIEPRPGYEQLPIVDNDRIVVQVPPAMKLNDRFHCAPMKMPPSVIGGERK